MLFILLIVIGASEIPSMQQMGPYTSAAACDAVRAHVEEMVSNAIGGKSGLQTRCVPVAISAN